MASWETMLHKLVQFGDQLPEDLRGEFHADPPSTRPWPRSLPTCPALTAFYSLCNGGLLGEFAVSGREDLDDLREWAGDDEYEAGRYLVFGDTMFGHPLVWDSVDDCLGYHDQDGADGLVMTNETRSGFAGLTMDQFLSGLFSGAVKPLLPETAESWAGVLEALNHIA